MSDARAAPPSFDEMVGLIKKLFTDYLEDVLKSKPEEIEKSWTRYKTLNHLYQDEQPAGAVWVKASERLPGYETPVKWRDGKDHSHATDGKIPLIHMAKPFLTGWEWLDEGTAAGREEDLQRIKDFNLSDVDAPAFTHTKEFEAHFSYIKGKLIDLIRKYETKQQKEK